jgi:crotonobetainyl-CoA:carnitine CoA-transferase CaiB-like acyl-CoA transferase
VCLNLKTDEGRAIVQALIRTADVVVENFAPGVAVRLGIGWDAVHDLNPRAVMCSISAFGQQGPLSALPGFDYIAQAYAGVTGMIGEADGAPMLPMLGLGDVNTGVHAACAIGFALLHRERTGQGQYLDISLLDAYAHCHEINVAMYGITGTSPTRSGNHHYAVCPLGLFRGKSRYLCIITLESQWPGMCRVIGKPECANDPRYANNAQRVAHAPEVIAMIQDWVDAQPDDDAVLAALNEAHVPCAPVLSIAEMATHPHMLARGTVRHVEDPRLGATVIPGMPLRFSAFPETLPLAAAHLGEHNAEVLSGLPGYPAARIASLVAAGVLHANPET